jgi:hypothetical protein
MSNQISLPRLHDATLVRLECRWEDGYTVVHLRTGDPSVPEAQLVAVAVRRVEFSRVHPWGPSSSVNEVRGPFHLPDEEGTRMEIEMQSGDVIVLHAGGFHLGGAELFGEQ